MAPKDLTDEGGRPGRSGRPANRRGLPAARWGLVAAGALLAVACSSGSSSSPATTAAGRTGTTVAATTGTTGAAKATQSVASSDLPDSIKAVMSKPRYADATWSLLVRDVETGETFYPLNAEQMSLTGSTRKLFSVGTALNELGADHREITPVYRTGSVDGGTLNGNLVLVASGDLTFGGRRIDADTVAVTDFDHNDANGLGTAELTPQDPLYALNDLAAQVKAAGITSVSGDVVIDDRLFQAYRVPNGNLLISPMLVNENMVDVTVTPTQPGQAASTTYRPQTGAFTVTSTVETGAAGSKEDVKLSDKGSIGCIGTPGCSGTISGSLPQGYVAPLSSSPDLVRTFRVEDPPSFARTAFIEALQRQGITVTAAPVAPNPSASLPPASSYTDQTKVGSYTSPPYAQDAKLILSQAQRCRDILKSLSSGESVRDRMHERMSIEALLLEAAGPHSLPGVEVNVSVSARGVNTADASAPVLTRHQEIVHALGAFIENAISFAESRVDVTGVWSNSEISILVLDDGPGFSEVAMAHLGEPYVSQREPDSGGGLGLGFFIAKTLVERSGGRVSFDNRTPPAHGAMVRATWPRSALEAPAKD